MTDHPSHTKDNSPSLSRHTRKEHPPQLGGDAAILHLVECLGNEDANVRFAAATKLAELGDSRAIDTLMTMMESYADDRHVKALANFGILVLPQLADLLGHDDWHASRQAALSLVQLGERGIAEAVVLSRSDNPQIRWLAILGLEEVGYLHNTPTAAFIEALYPVHPYITDFAARMLGKRNDPAVVPQLKSLMTDESVHIRIRRSSAEALAFMGYTDGIELFIRGIGGGLHNPQTAVRAAESLGEKIFPLLVPRLENWEWHLPITEFLGWVKHPGVVPAVIVGLDDEQPHVRSAAAYILGQQADPRATEALIAALEDEDISVQSSAAWALEKIGTSEAMATMEQWRSKLSLDDQYRFDNGHALADEHD